jgi:HD superfamily phosphodiesterase
MDTELLSEYGIDGKDFELKQSYFENVSFIHGIKHTERVMTHCLLIGKLIERRYEAFLAFCAAYVHDMGRSGDGYNTVHGRISAEKKLPFFTPLFRKYGVSDKELKYIESAVIQHCVKEWSENGDDDYHVMAILKDADALDRVRINDLNPDMLRYEESKTLIDKAWEVFRADNKDSCG